jgi:hypothetical protein
VLTTLRKFSLHWCHKETEGQSTCTCASQTHGMSLWHRYPSFVVCSHSHFLTRTNLQDASQPVILPVDQSNFSQLVGPGQEIEIDRYLTPDEEMASVQLAVTKVTPEGDIHCRALCVPTLLSGQSSLCIICKWQQHILCDLLRLHCSFTDSLQNLAASASCLFVCAICICEISMRGYKGPDPLIKPVEKKWNQQWTQILKLGLGR